MPPRAGPLRPSAIARIDAVQRLDVLMRRPHAGNDVAQIDLHGRALVRRAEELDPLQFAFERREEGEQLLLRRRRGFFRHGEGQLARRAQFEPFVGDDHHGLRQIERSEGRIDRQRENSVGKRDLVVLEPVALAAEHDGDGLAGIDAGRHRHGRFGRADDGLRLVVGARGRGEDERAVADRILEGLVERRAVENGVGADRHDARLGIGPGLPRRDEAQPRQAEIRHRARRRADILAELRLDQDDDRAGSFGPYLGSVGSCAGHGDLLAAGAAGAMAAFSRPMPML